MSYYSEKDLIKVLRGLDVQIFVIGVTHLLSNELVGITRTSPKVKAEGLINRLANETGGRAFLPKTTHELLAATEQIIHDLHLQYIIGYVPLSAAREKDFRELKVSLKNTSGGDKRIAITRRGYSRHSGEKAPDKKNDKQTDKKSP